jgi:hypothetical protein
LCIFVDLRLKGRGWFGSFLTHINAVRSQMWFMPHMIANIVRSALLAALIFGPTAADAAPAKKRAPTTPPKMSAVEECCKQQGGTYEGKCNIYTWSEHGGIGRQDALRQCISSKTGLRRDQIPIHTRYIDRPGANY